MVRQPIPELIRLYELDDSLFSVRVEVLSTHESVPFSCYYIKHLPTKTTLIIKELSKYFPNDSIFDKECEVSHSVECSSFKLSALEIELLVETFQGYLTIWQKAKDNLSEDNKNRSDVNKLLYVEDTYCNIHTSESKDSC